MQSYEQRGQRFYVRCVVYNLAGFAFFACGKFYNRIIDTANCLAFLYGFEFHNHFCAGNIKQVLTPSVTYFERVAAYDEMRKFLFVLQRTVQSEFYVYNFSVLRLNSIGKANKFFKFVVTENIRFDTA